MKTIRTHFIIMGMLFCTAMLAVMSFTMVIDPYNIFGNFLQVKQRPANLKSKSQLTKSVQIIRQKPDTIVFGSSTVDCGYALPGSMSAFTNKNFNDDMQHLKARLPSQANIYNAGINGGTLYDIYFFIQHAYKNNPNLKHIIVGLEWHLFTDEMPPGPTKFEVPALKKTHIPLKLYIDTLLTLHSISDAFQTLDLNYELTQSVTDAFFDLHLIKELRAKSQEHAAKVVSQDPLHRDLTPIYFQPPNKQLIVGRASSETSALLVSIYYLSTLYSHFKEQGDKAVLNPEAFIYLQRIVAFAKEKKLRLDIYITPQHATHWVTAQRFGLGTYVDDWLRRVASITPFWDFSGRVDFNDKVTSYFSGDDRHFSYIAGEIILPAILRGKADAPSGIYYVTNANIEQMIRYRHRLQANWLKRNKYLASIFSSSQFPAMRHRTVNIRELLFQYQPVYHHYNIFQFLSGIVAVPEEYAPYDLGRFFRGDYPNMIYGQTLGVVTAQIDKRQKAQQAAGV